MGGGRGVNNYVRTVQFIGLATQKFDMRAKATFDTILEDTLPRMTQALVGGQPLSRVFEQKHRDEVFGL